MRFYSVAIGRQIRRQLAACARLGYRTLCKIVFVLPTDRLAMQQCWHHDRRTGETWIQDRMVDLGRDKVFRCSRCNEIWLSSWLGR